ncbi:TlpA disulfide reductase family protein [Phycisphaeraceae bacterium D3-23]
MHVRTGIAAAAIAAMTVPALADVGVGDSPEFEFTTLEGVEVSSEDLDGKVVVLDFWATWCGPCIRSFPHMKDLYERYHEMGVDVYGMSIDEERAPLDAFLEENDLPWHIAHDEDAWEGMAADFGVTGIPSIFVFSPEGEVVWAGHPMGLTEEVMDGIAVEYLDAELPTYTYEVVLEMDEVLDEEDGRTYDEGKFLQKIEIELEAGESYQIDMMSDNFDTFVAVHSPSGKVEVNDDGPEGTNSRVAVRAAEAGTYTVYATSFAAGESGGYILRVQHKTLDGADQN